MPCFDRHPYTANGQPASRTALMLIEKDTSMTNFNHPTTADPKSLYSFFTNEYTLTMEICAEAEISRIDTGIAYVLTISAAMMIAFFRPLLSLVPQIPGLLYAYFSSPSPGTILELSGFNGLLPFVSVSITGAAILMIKAFPQLVGEKRLEEQLKFLPSPNRQVNFYDQYIEVKGKFHKNLPYKELKRTGETRSLYLLYFTEKRVLILPKNRFYKGSLPELKPFIREHRTLKSKLYGAIRWLPVVFVFLLFLILFWTEY